MSTYRFRRWIWKISRIGIYHNHLTGTGLAEKVMLSNRLTLMVLLTMLCFVCLYTYLGFERLAFLVTLGVALMCFCLFLNFKQHFKTSRTLMLLSCNVLLALSDVAFNFQGGIEYYFIPSVLTTYLFFEFKEIRLLSAVATFPVIAWIVPRYFAMDEWNLFEPVSRDLTRMLRYVNWITAFFLTSYQSHIFVRSVVHYQKRLTHLNKLNALGEMAAGLAHEISSPLAVIVAKSTNLKEQIASGKADQNKAVMEIEKIEFMGFRISKIIQGLMAFSQNTEFEKPELARMEDIIQESVELCDDRLKSIPVTCEVKVKESAQCYCHPIQLTQVLVNLINNSIDAVQDQNKPWIVVDLELDGSYAMIRVTDSGNGIPLNTVSNIMNPFFTTKRAGKGTGLGLSISKKIVESVGGRLFVDIRSPNTCFVIQLPAVLS